MTKQSHPLAHHIMRCFGMVRQAHQPPQHDNSQTTKKRIVILSASEESPRDNMPIAERNATRHPGRGFAKTEGMGSRKTDTVTHEEHPDEESHAAGLPTHYKQIATPFGLAMTYLFFCPLPHTHVIARNVVTKQSHPLAHHITKNPPPSIVIPDAQRAERESHVH